MTSDPILSGFQRRLHRTPNAPMIISRHGEASAQDIDLLARALAEDLTASGMQPGSLVGLSASNGPGFLAGLLGLRYVGATALLFDQRTPKNEKERTSQALGATFDLTTQRAWTESVADFALTPVAGSTPPRLGTDVAVVKLTSGSTGCPRGIVTPSKALVADDAALAKAMGLRENERIVAALPMSHSYALSSVVMPALMRDAVLILPRAGHPLDPMIIAREQRATFFPSVPAYLQALVKMSTPPRAPSSLRLVTSAGAPLKPETAVRFRAIYGLPIHVFYGSSECGGITFDRTGDAGERGSLGTPVDGVRVSLETLPEAGDEVQGKERGAVVVQSPAVASGYLPTPDPTLSAGRFRTNDLGRWCDGELILEGRLGDVINIRGKKVDPLEVNAVLQQLEAVEEAVTLGVELPGKDEAFVRSFVACQPGSLCAETVQQWCRRHLASYKVPRSIVLLERLPRTDRGKLDRAALLAQGRSSNTSAGSEGETVNA